VARAVRLITPWSFQALGLNGLEVRTDKRNLAFQRVAEKAGFARIGVVRTIGPSAREEYEDVIYCLAYSPWTRACSAVGGLSGGSRPQAAEAGRSGTSFGLGRGLEALPGGSQGGRAPITPLAR
jgi:hypothetical protein